MDDNITTNEKLKRLRKMLVDEFLNPSSTVTQAGYIEDQFIYTLKRYHPNPEYISEDDIEGLKNRRSGYRYLVWISKDFEHAKMLCIPNEGWHIMSPSLMEVSFYELTGHAER